MSGVQTRMCINKARGRVRGEDKLHIAWCMTHITKVILEEHSKISREKRGSAKRSAKIFTLFI